MGVREEREGEGEDIFSRKERKGRQGYEFFHLCVLDATLAAFSIAPRSQGGFRRGSEPSSAQGDGCPAENHCTEVQEKKDDARQEQGTGGLPRLRL